MSVGDDVSYCVYSCGRPAVTERVLDVLEDGADDITPVVELVCAWHARLIEAVSQ